MPKVAVRYQSRGGHTRAIAEALAHGAGVEAIEITAPGGRLTEPVDLLFLGGAVYGLRLDKTMYAYLDKLDPELVGSVVIFATAGLTRRPILQIKEKLAEKGIEISPQAVFGRNKPHKFLLEAAEDFAAREVAVLSGEVERHSPLYYTVKANDKFEAEKAAKKGEAVAEEDAADELEVAEESLAEAISEAQAVTDADAPEAE